MMSADSIIRFWFEEISAKQHWVKDESFDRDINERFLGTLQGARNNELFQWRLGADSSAIKADLKMAQGRLAEIIVLDQFSRNIFRDTAESFAADAQALTLAQEAVQLGCLELLPSEQQAFLLMPYMHSESALVHQHAVPLFEQLNNENTLNFELKHKAIIDTFGRYPHRNIILGRQSTAAETEFLQQPGSSF